MKDRHRPRPGRAGPEVRLPTATLSPSGAPRVSPDPVEAPAAPVGLAGLGRAEMLLLRRAARERWGVPDALKTESLSKLAAILEDPSSPRRLRIAAIRTLADFDKVDRADEKLALERAKFERAGPAEPEVTAAAAVRSMQGAAARRAAGEGPAE